MHVLSFFQIQNSLQPELHTDGNINIAMDRTTISLLLIAVGLSQQEGKKIVVF